MSDDRLARPTRVRREPPPLQPVRVVEWAELSPRLLRLTFEGDGLRELAVGEPAASVRLLVPTPGTDELVMPAWNGNEFTLPDGSRPALRTFTPLRVDNSAGRLDIEIVRHLGGAVSDWAESVSAGAQAAISGPGTGYEYPLDADRLLALADETALPAAMQLIEMAPRSLTVHLHLEVVSADAIIDPGIRPGIRPDDRIEWHVSEPGAVPGGRIVAVARSLDDVPGGTFVWAAGEASAMHAIRTHLFGDLGLARSRATVRGYWKPVR